MSEFVCEIVKCPYCGAEFRHDDDDVKIDNYSYSYESHSFFEQTIMHCVKCDMRIYTSAIYELKEFVVSKELRWKK